MGLREGQRESITDESQGSLFVSLFCKTRTHTFPPLEMPATFTCQSGPSSSQVRSQAGELLLAPGRPGHTGDPGCCTSASPGGRKGPGALWPPLGNDGLRAQGLCFLPSLRVDCRCLFVALCAYCTLLRVLWSCIQEAPRHGVDLLNKGTWNGESPRQHSALCEHPKGMRVSLLTCGCDVLWRRNYKGKVSV